MTITINTIIFIFQVDNKLAFDYLLYYIQCYQNNTFHNRHVQCNDLLFSYYLIFKVSAHDRTRTYTENKPPDPKSGAYTNFATWASTSSEIQTHNPWLRRPLLYSVKLWRQIKQPDIINITRINNKIQIKNQNTLSKAKTIRPSQWKLKFYKSIFEYSVRLCLLVPMNFN